MRRYFIPALSGLIFGLGLAIAGMTNPAKVLGFLDITGKWDPSLLLVLGGAVGVTVLSFPWVLRQPKPRFAEIFCLPKKQAIDRPLLMGATLFGMGWGLAGYCPGPGLTLLTSPLLTQSNWETWVFVPAMMAGFALYRLGQHGLRHGSDQI